MNFRSMEDLARAVRNNLHRLPRDIDVVAGIPRSGLLPASMIALYRNLALTDVEGLIERRSFAAGTQRTKPATTGNPERWRRVLLVDDSIQSGVSMKAALDRLRALDRWNIVSCAVFGTAQSASQVDLMFENCPPPRMFEWNLMHHPLLKCACVDIDGVLCADPSEAENDDGALYGQFLGSARPFMLPTLRVGAIVSSRLEKYRRETERWLHANGVEFGELRLLDLESARERRKRGTHAQFKARIYAESPDWRIFIESDPRQAAEIASRTGKAVVCTQNMAFFPETPGAALRRKVARRLSAWALAR